MWSNMGEILEFQGKYRVISIFCYIATSIDDRITDKKLTSDLNRQWHSVENSIEIFEKCYCLGVHGFVRNKNLKLLSVFRYTCILPAVIYFPFTASLVVVYHDFSTGNLPAAGFSIVSEK
ncbi:hypothetical protein BDA99DRAFT_571136 [Phascolomyces articulosus]|uniref:Uncharacterized protein n=1 Tax=Phascolomyces articulosus TaxID=60185 RepID=A0AAD5KDC2_9FUNG|nr:hypothetical protein BDA99DRAFT_571136 [Phascolomyces articulosus]